MAPTITRRIGIALLAAATVAVGLSTPASAVPVVQAAVAGTGSITGTYTYPSAGYAVIAEVLAPAVRAAAGAAGYCRA